MKRIILAIVAGLSMVNSVQAIRRGAAVPARSVVSVAPKQNEAELKAAELKKQEAEKVRAAQLAEAAKKAAEVKAAQLKKEAEQKSATFKKRLLIGLGVFAAAATAGVVAPEVYNAYNKDAQSLSERIETKKLFDEQDGYWRPLIAKWTKPADNTSSAKE